MGFVLGRRLADYTPPTILYVHKAGFRTPLFITAMPTESTEGYYNEIIESKKHLLKDFDYVIAVLWGDESRLERVIDVFGYSDIREWPGNPDVSAFVIRDGAISYKGPTTCEDTLIVLGKEGEHRRKTKSLEEYLSTEPELSELEPELGFL